MRILGLTDVLKEKDLDKGVKEAFPEAEVRYLEWPAAAQGILSKENLNIEKNGAEVGMPIPGILEVVRDFDPEVIIAPLLLCYQLRTSCPCRLHRCYTHGKRSLCFTVTPKAHYLNISSKRQLLFSKYP